jgi:hypothetical protein
MTTSLVKQVFDIQKSGIYRNDYPFRVDQEFGGYLFDIKSLYPWIIEEPGTYKMIFPIQMVLVDRVVPCFTIFFYPKADDLKT